MPTFRGYIGSNKVPGTALNANRLDFREPIVITDAEHARNFDGCMGNCDPLSAHVFKVMVTLDNPCDWQTVAEVVDSLGLDAEREAPGSPVDNNDLLLDDVITTLQSLGYDGVAGNVAMENYEIHVVVPFSGIVTADFSNVEG